DSRIYRVQKKLLAVHGSGAMIGRIHSSAHPFEIPNLVARDPGMDIRGLGYKRWPHFESSDWLRQIIRRHRTEGLIHIRKMLAVEFVEVAVVGRMMLRPVPPVPVAALGNQKLVKGQIALGFSRPCGVLRIILTRVTQIIPGAIVLRRSNPDVEVRIDPGTRCQRAESAEILVVGDRFGNRHCLESWLSLEGIIKAAQKLAPRLWVVFPRILAIE